MDTISARNPDLDEMKERGWAWVLRSTLTGTEGAPTTDDAFAANAVYRAQADGELIIISFED